MNYHPVDTAYLALLQQAVRGTDERLARREGKVTVGMSRGNGTGTGLLAAVAMIACCGLLLLAITAGGAIAAVGGLAERYWPLTALGIAVAVWAGTRLGRVLRARRGSLRENQNSEH